MNGRDTLHGAEVCHGVEQHATRDILLAHASRTEAVRGGHFPLRTQLGRLCPLRLQVPHTGRRRNCAGEQGAHKKSQPVCDVQGLGWMRWLVGCKCTTWAGVGRLFGGGMLRETVVMLSGIGDGTGFFVWGEHFRLFEVVIFLIVKILLDSRDAL